MKKKYILWGLPVCYTHLIRTLSRFAAERLITIDGRKIKIIEEEKLKKISKIG